MVDADLHRLELPEEVEVGTAGGFAVASEADGAPRRRGPDEAVCRQGPRPGEHGVRRQAREAGQLLDPGDEPGSCRSGAIEEGFEVKGAQPPSSLRGGAQRGRLSEQLDESVCAHMVPVRDLGHEAGDRLDIAGARTDGMDAEHARAR